MNELDRLPSEESENHHESSVPGRGIFSKMLSFGFVSENHSESENSPKPGYSLELENSLEPERLEPKGLESENSLEKILQQRIAEQNVHALADQAKHEIAESMQLLEQARAANNEIQDIHRAVQSFAQEKSKVDELIASQMAELNKSQKSVRQYEMALQQFLNGPIREIGNRLEKIPAMESEREEIEKLKTEINTIARSLFEQKTQNTKLRQIMEVQKNKLVTLEVSILNQVKRHLQKNHEIADKADQNQQALEAQKQTVQDALCNIQNIYTEVQELVGCYQEEEKKIQKIIKNLISDYDSVKNQISDLARDVYQKYSEFDEVKEKADQACNTLITLIEREKQRSERVEEAMLRVDQLESEAQGQLNEIKHCLHHSEAVNEKTEQYHQALKILLDENIKLENISREYLKNCETLTQESMQAHAEKLTEQKALCDQVAQKEIWIREAIKQIHGVKNQCLELVKASQAMVDKTNILETQLEKDQKDRQQVLEHSQNARNEAIEALENISGLNTQVERVLTQVADSLVEVGAVKSSIAESQQQVREMTFRENQLRSNIENKMKTLVEIQANCQETLSKTMDIQSQCNEIKEIKVQTESLLKNSETALLEVKELQESVCQTLNKIQDQESKNNALAQSVQSTHLAAQAGVKEILNIKQKTTDLIKQAEKILERSVERDAQIKKAIEDNKQICYRTDSLNDGVEAVLDRVSDSEKRINNLVEENNQLTQFVDEKAKEIHQGTIEAHNLRDKLNALISEAQEALNENKTLKEKANLSLVKSEDNHLKIVQIKEQVQESIDRFEKSCLKSEQLNQEIAPKLIQLDNLSNRVGQALNQLSQDREEYQTLSQACSDLVEQSKLIQTDSRVLHENHISDLEQAKSEVTGLHHQLNQSLETQKNFQNELKKYQLLYSELLKEKGQYHNNLKQLEEVQDVMLEKLEYFSKKMEQLEKNGTESLENLKRIEDLSNRVEKTETLLEKVAVKIKEFMKTHQESKVLNKETLLGAKEQKLALKELENEIKELKYTLKVVEKSPTGFVGRKYPLQELPEKQEEEAPPKKSEIDFLSEQIEALSGEELLNLEDNNRKKGGGFKSFLFSLVLLAGASLSWQVKEIASAYVPQPASLAVDLVSFNTPVLSGLTWPLDQSTSQILVQYGDYRQGVYLKTALGAPVLAIQDGIVLYSGMGVGGLGKLVILQHADELISIYGNNQNNYVHAGEQVFLGQTIASVGQVEAQTPSLYFEIRYHGLAEDPFLYFSNRVS